jgi:hypothetical protein
MLRSAVPPSFPIPFASSAGAGFIRAIPQASQIGITNGAASLTDGFPPLNFSPVAAGGVPPFGEDFNGLMNQVTLWNQWQEAGAPSTYNSAFSTSIGGYPQAAELSSAILIGRKWVSLVDNNTTDPDSSAAANWAAVGVPVGAPIALFSTTVPSGYVLMNALTIGNASSGATGRANADTFFLFVYNWLNFSNSVCPLFNSAGTAIARGANPYADFAANNRLQVPELQGTSFIGADTMAGVATSLLAGVPVQFGSTTVPGSYVGENLHTLIAAEIPAISSVGGALGVSVSVSGSASVNSTIDVLTAGTGGQQFDSAVGSGEEFSAFNFSNVPSLTGVPSTGSFSGSGSGGTSGQSVVSNNTGSGAHNNTERSMIVFWGQKL